MGFLDDVFDALLDPLNHPAEAAMMMSMMDDETLEDAKMAYEDKRERTIPFSLFA